ncbi:MAG: hypothetical protein V2B15_12495 [Bacteroidota bacterium]
MNRMQLNGLLSFWEKHPAPFIYNISGRYKLTRGEIGRFRDILCWPELAGNQAVDWSTGLVDEFLDLLVRKDQFLWKFHFNESLPWSPEFLERYQDYL